MPNNLSKGKFDLSKQYRPAEITQCNWNFIIYFINENAYFIDSKAFQYCRIKHFLNFVVHLPVEGLCNDLLVIKSGLVLKPSSFIFDQQTQEFPVPILAKLENANPYLLEKLNVLPFVPVEKSKQWKLLYLAIALVTFYPNELGMR